MNAHDDTATRLHRRTSRRLAIPMGQSDAKLAVESRTLRVTNLEKLFWSEEKITKGALLRYYTDIAPVLLPHLRDRAMVMKRYPDGIEGDFFYMKRPPRPRPEWVATCAIEHASGSVIDFAMVQDLPSLLWIINLGCIDLNPWYSRCDDFNRPDYLHFDLDPVTGDPPVPFAHVREAALRIKNGLDTLKMPSLANSSGSRGIHVYVPIQRGPTQKQVWRFAKAFAQRMAARHPELITAEYRIAKRPPGRVLADYNQNAWGRTLASVYSVRPRPGAPVAVPVTWQEVADGFAITDHTLRNVPARVARLGDLWQPLLAEHGRVQLEAYL
jgi:bifunctional non-homologous end joining protein LigD